jgi:hypothetical protein
METALLIGFGVFVLVGFIAMCGDDVDSDEIHP